MVDDKPLHQPAPTATITFRDPQKPPRMWPHACVIFNGEPAVVEVWRDQEKLAQFAADEVLAAEPCVLKKRPA